MSWTSIRLVEKIRKNEKFYWEMTGLDSKSLVIGLLSAATTFLRDVHDKDFVLVLRKKSGESFDVRDLDDLDEINENPLEHEFSTEEQIENIYPTTTNYGIWIDRYGRRKNFDFVGFNQADKFMQGFISMCNAFKVDFRHYILGPPFDRDGLEYNVVGYDIEPYFPSNYEEGEGEEYEEYEEGEYEEGEDEEGEYEEGEGEYGEGQEEGEEYDDDYDEEE